MRMVHGVGMAYRTEPNEAVVAVSYQRLSVLPYLAFPRFLRGRCGHVATEVRASN